MLLTYNVVVLNMGDFMPQNAGELITARNLKKKTGVNVDIPAGDRKGIELPVLDNEKAIGEGRLLQATDDSLAQLLYILLYGIVPYERQPGQCD